MAEVKTTNFLLYLLNVQFFGAFSRWHECKSQICMLFHYYFDFLSLKVNFNFLVDAPCLLKIIIFVLLGFNYNSHPLLYCSNIDIIFTCPPLTVKNLLCHLQTISYLLWFHLQSLSKIVAKWSLYEKRRYICPLSLYQCFVGQVPNHKISKNQQWVRGKGIRYFVAFFTVLSNIYARIFWKHINFDFECFHILY